MNNRIGRRQFLASTTLLGVSGVASAATDPIRSATVQRVSGTPLLHVNGKPVNPLVFFAGPHRIPSLKDNGASSPLSAKQWLQQRPRSAATIPLAAGAGIHIQSFSVWMPWFKPGQEPDYSDTDEAIGMVLERDPKGMLLLRFDLDPPQWWREAHPEELAWWDTEQGPSRIVDDKHSVQLESAVTTASELWRRDANQQLSRFVEHLEKKFGTHIIGYHACGQNTHEWFHLSSHGNRLTCAGPAFERSWRRWLKEKYATEAELRKAWRDARAEFALIKNPTFAERTSASLGFFRDPAREQKLIDFHEFQSVATVEALEQFAATIKSKSRKLVVFFYGYLYELSRGVRGPQQSGHFAMGRLLDCPNVDVVCSPNSYQDRLGGGIGAFMTVVDSVSLRGKLWCNEDDTGTHVAAESQFGERPLADSGETWGVYQRQFAHLFPRKMTCWYMDLSGLGWLDDAGIWRDLAKFKKLYDGKLGAPSHFNPEIAVLADERSNFYLTQKPEPLTRGLVGDMRGALYRMGAPIGHYLLDDLVHGRIPKKKLYIFLNCFALSKAARKAIAVQCAGATCLFFYGNGLIEEGADVRNMSALMNAPIAMSMEAVEPRVVATERGLAEFGGKSPISPVFYLEADRARDVVLLGSYKANGRPAAWTAPGAYRSIYIGTTQVPAALLRRLASDAGVHIYSNSDDVIDGDDELLGIHASSAGRKQLRIPAAATVKDLWTGEVIAANAVDWPVEMKKGETRLFHLSLMRAQLP